MKRHVKTHHGIILLLLCFILALTLIAQALSKFDSLTDTLVVAPAHAQIALEGAGSGLIGWWKLNEGSGAAASDSSGNNNTGTLTNGPTWTTGKIGSGAMSFDGVDDFIKVPSLAITNENGGTVSFWLYYRNSRNNNGFVVSSNIAPNIFDSSGHIRMYVDDLTSGFPYAINFSGGVIPLNQWVHYAVTYDASGGNIYKNGILEATGNTTSGIFRQINDLYIGGQSFGGPNKIDGIIDDVRIYNRALSSNEIQELYNLNSQNIPPVSNTNIPSIPIAQFNQQPSGNNNWYVDKDAIGNNDGTSWQNAWTSLSQVKTWHSWSPTGVKGGDTLLISGGNISKTYFDTLKIEGNAGTDPTHRINIMVGQEAGHNGQVIIDGQNNNLTAGVDLSGASYVTLSGNVNGQKNLIIQNVIGNSVSGGIRAQGINNGIIEFVEIRHVSNGMTMNLATQTEVRNCDLSDIRLDHAIWIGGNTKSYDDNVVRHCRIQLNRGTKAENFFGPDGIQGSSGVTVHDNYIYAIEVPGTVNQHQDAIQPLGSYWKIYNNVILNMGNSAIWSQNMGEAEYGNYYFYNNVVATTDPVLLQDWSRGVGWVVVPGVNQLKNFFIFNNTFVDLHFSAIRVEFDRSRNVSDPVSVSNFHINNNLIYNSGIPSGVWSYYPIHFGPFYQAGFIPATGFSINDLDIDYNSINRGNRGDDHINVNGVNFTQPHSFNDIPNFVSYSEFKSDNNFHLQQEDTSALDRGINLNPYFTYDIENISRPQGDSWDIGAYECSNGQSVVPVNGLCSTAQNSCLTGIFSDTADSSTQYLWSCLGSNGGATVSCSLAKPLSPDITLPTISITSPANNATISGTITLSAAASDPVVIGQTTAGIQTVQFKLDGASLGQELTTAPYSGDWNTIGVANGSHTLLAIARDSAGNTATADSVNLIVANTSTSSPVSGACSTGLNTCVSGALSDTADTSTNYLWQCLGSTGSPQVGLNGGANATCSLAIPLSTNGGGTTPPTNGGGGSNGGGGGTASGSSSAVSGTSSGGGSAIATTTPPFTPSTGTFTPTVVQKPLVPSTAVIVSFPITNNSLYEKLKGKIILRVQSHGEAYYISPKEKKMYYLGRPVDAFQVIRGQGLGITNVNLEKIPVDLSALSGLDSDNDGLPDAFEQALGTDPNKADTDNDGHGDKEELTNGFSPLAKGKTMNYDQTLAVKQKGKILLQVEHKGEAWYINPTDGQRYFLARPADAFNLMRRLGVGITNANYQALGGK